MNEKSLRKKFADKGSIVTMAIGSFLFKLHQNHTFALIDKNLSK